ncbi:hypothetical protein GA0070624_5020 [Micromonospora rhizosphaerae]|uniref:Uncharacterized protein n=1 Tax=Micromonospora rhizosphaerae TaxID=568872 RepID=A0A1C6SZM7_9ACTN|nr:hypothetical protein [Micromonospora rhizosphaerae]SCL34545.1 hypothetical protein GA0070624_5020 [Micromonospora rhizosphaerae]
MALAVSAGTDDPQLSGVTVGKPLDLAAVGHLDQLVYDDTNVVAYAAYNWVLSQRQVTLAPGETFTLRRRIAAADSGEGADPFAALGQL